MTGRDVEGEWLRSLALAVVAAMALFDWAAALRAFRHAPAAADLYHLVYPHDPRRRGEDTTTFILGFPIAVTLALVLMVMRAIRSRPARPRDIILPLFVTGLFTVGEAGRAHAVLAMFP